MNIIEYLIQDHEQLFRDRVGIQKNLTKERILKNKIKQYIADLELHEAIEHKFLISRVKTLPQESELYELWQGYEEQHQTIWRLLEKLLELADSQDLPTIQQAFFNFFAFLESHTSDEEHIFFPEIRKTLGEDLLEELGKEAEEYSKRFQRQTVQKES